MSFTLADFALPDPEEIELPSGICVPIRPLSMDIEQDIDAALPAPRVPMIKDPNAGSKAPKVPDDQDPVYLEAWHINYNKRMLAKIAVSIDLVLTGTIDGHSCEGGCRYQDCVRAGSLNTQNRVTTIQWCHIAVEQLGSVVTRAWLKKAYKILTDLSLGKAIAEGASGNSSAPPEAAGD